MIQAAKIIGTGLATTRLICAGAGIGVVFGALIFSLALVALILGVVSQSAKSPSLRGQLFLLCYFSIFFFTSKKNRIIY
jgi:F-type H+-transporting ATPase subunit c